MTAAESCTQQLSAEDTTSDEQHQQESSSSTVDDCSSLSFETSKHAVPDPLPVPQAIALLQEYFSNAVEQKQLHSFYTCSGKCSDLPESEKTRIQCQKKANDGKKKGVRYV